MAPKDFSKALNEACILWKEIYYIFNVPAMQERISDTLKQQIQNANVYLLSRVKWLGDVGAISVLEQKD